jgi:hypothetical protein
MPSQEYLQGLLDLNNNQRRELARLNAKCDALARELEAARRQQHFTAVETEKVIRALRAEFLNKQPTGRTT